MHARALLVRVAVVLAVIVGGGALATARPKAPVTVDAELLTLHAVAASKRHVDPRLGNHPALSRPPLDAYTSYRVLRRGGAVLAKGMAWRTRLPNDRELLISLKDVVMPKRKRDAPPRFVVAASIGHAGVYKQVLETEVAAGEIFFVPAERYRGGIVVVSVRLLAP
jgi:hypothetical protein